MPNFTPIGATVRIQDPQTEFFLLRFDQNVESLRDFHKICRVCTPFQDALAVKISLDLLKGLICMFCYHISGEIKLCVCYGVVGVLT